MSQIAVIGTGYVGLVSGALLSDFGHNVICVDTDEEKINKLKNNIIPIFEPGLDNVVSRNVFYNRLSFTISLTEAVNKSDIIFIAVGTPPKDDGSADLTYVLQAAKDIASCMENDKIIVNKSTVPIGTGQKVATLMREILNQREVQLKVDIVSNPEFLREGSAVYDFSHPDRVVIGAEKETVFQAMKEVYRVLYLNETPFVETNIETAEMIKYASNAFLAMKITYMNEIANLCEKVGANVKDVAKAMGKDGRISNKFLHAGPGYGGSCFPKDTNALVEIAKENDERITLIESAIRANENQKLRMVHKIINVIGNLGGKTLAILGLTFKPNTDDMREAPSLIIIPKLIEAGAKVKVFDPEGEKEAKWRLAQYCDHIEYCTDEYNAITGADATVILTEWNQFRNLDFDRIGSLNSGKILFDLRNIYTRQYVEEKGFLYIGVGV